MARRRFVIYELLIELRPQRFNVKTWLNKPVNAPNSAPMKSLIGATISPTARPSMTATSSSPHGEPKNHAGAQNTPTLNPPMITIEHLKPAITQDKSTTTLALKASETPPPIRPQPTITAAPPPTTDQPHIKHASKPKHTASNPGISTGASIAEKQSYRYVRRARLPWIILRS